MPSEPHDGRLRILHVSEVQWGGVVSLLRPFAAQQDREGHEVHVLAPDGMPPIPRSTPHRWRLRRARPWSVVPALLDLRRTVRSVAPDVIHLHSFIAGLVVRLPGIRRWLGADIPAVYQPHSWSFDLYAFPAFGFCLRRWERWASVRTDVLVANGDDEISEARALGIKTPAQVLGVTVDLTRFAPVSADDRSALRRELGIESPKVLLCLGRLTWQKAQDLLLPAWEEARPADTVLYLVGPGDSEPLRALAPTQWGRTVKAVGERDDVEAWLSACDVAVLSSRYEGLSIVSAEALASGIPVVSTDVSGARATIIDGPLPPAGAVVPLGDMRALVDACESRLVDPELHAAESRAARDRAEGLFDQEVIGRRLESAYRQAIDVHSAPAGTR